jgi:CelD/BcsL family acetyltransferase involved in cellulose biosynthesis
MSRSESNDPAVPGTKVHAVSLVSAGLSVPVPVRPRATVTAEAVTIGGHVCLVRAVDSLDFTGADFRRLHASADATVFQSPEWLEGLYRVLLPTLPVTPCIVTVHGQADGRLMLVLPLVRRRIGLLDVIEFPDFDVSNYGGGIVSQTDRICLADDPALAAAIARAIGPFDLFLARKVLPDHLWVGKLIAGIRSTPREYCHHVLDTGHRVGNPPRLSRRSFHGGIARKLGRLRRDHHVELTRAATASDVADRIERLDTWTLRRYGRGLACCKQSLTTLLGASAVTPEASASAHVYALLVDGEPAAIITGLSGRGTFCAVMTGFDDRFARDSVGLIAFRELIGRRTELGDLSFDFSLGDQTYKSLFGARSLPVHMLTAAGSWRGAIASRVLRTILRLRTARRASSPRGHRTVTTGESP